MFRRNKAYFIIIAVLLVILLAFLIYYFTNNQTSKESYIQYQTSFIEDETIVYLGKAERENEVLFIFDYSCIWCSRWIDEIFPRIKQLIDEDKVKFRTQSMVFLNEASLQLSKLDQNIKEYYPDKYFDIFSQIITDGLREDLEQLLANNYIDKLLAGHQLDSNILHDEPKIDVINLTRKYTNELNIESVPTIIVNGAKVTDPFSLEDIEKLLK